MHGYAGQLLRINLSTRTWVVEEINWNWVKLYYGARGLGIRYLIDEIPANLDPLHPENRIMFLTGPLTGTLAPSAGKLSIVTKSPATGTILDCSVGGSIGSAIKIAGHDGIVIQGRADSPVYVLVDGESVEIRDASVLWGKGCHETESRLVEELGVNTSVISIGPAGENQVPFACLSSDYYRQAGRGGAGAVAGSKNLKAIAVKGYRGVRVPDMDKFLGSLKSYVSDLLPSTQWAYETGTPGLVSMSQKAGILPTRNFHYGQFDGYTSLGPEAMGAARKRKKACFGCPIACGNFIKVGKVFLEGPEYETLALVGSNCGIADLETVAEFNRLCDDLGIDTMSAGNMVALAMDMTEQGIKDFGIHFNDAENYLRMPELIATRRDIGADLALGAKAVAHKYHVEDLVMEVKGLEFPGYDPRGSWGMGLGYATSHRGACHMQGFTVGREAFGDLDPFTGTGKAQVAIEKQDMNSIKWSLTVCDFWPLTYQAMADLYNITVGLQVDEAEMQQAGERIYNLTRLFNVREGFRRDKLPFRVFTEPLKGTGPAAGKTIPYKVFEEMLSEYYRLRGWNEQGIPERGRLAGLRIDPQCVETCLS